MDAKTGFGVLLVLVGVFAAFLAVTGKAKAIIAAITGSAPQSTLPATAAPAMQSDPGQAGTRGAAGGSWSSPTQVSQTGGITVAFPSDELQAMQYNALIGTDGRMNDNAQIFWNGVNSEIAKVKEPWRALVFAAVLLVGLWVLPWTRKFAVPAGLIIGISWLIIFFKKQQGA
jgi:hypothetical protein